MSGTGPAENEAFQNSSSEILAMNQQIFHSNQLSKPAAILLLLVCIAVALPCRAQYAPLTKVADIPLPGPAVRFDYQSLDVSGAGFTSRI
jgi:hypothetical protein